MILEQINSISVLNLPVWDTLDEYIYLFNFDQYVCVYFKHICINHQEYLKSAWTNERPCHCHHKIIDNCKN